MRTQQQIVEKIKKHQDKFMDFTSEVLLPYLEFEHAKQFLREGITEKEWSSAKNEYTTDAIMKDVSDYMVFAIGKATDHRGISANRSIDKMKTWLWLLGKDELLKKVEATPYANYGAPKLKVICEGLDLPWPTEEQNGPINEMARGDRCSLCRDGTYSGCGA